MTTSITSEEWERWRNAIHTLYILQDLPLCGPSGLIEQMKLRYGFHASKRQYEYRFEQWGSAFEKKMPGSNYRIIAPKIRKRKRAGKESSVYWKGELVPAAKVRKESTRHGYMTTLERLNMMQAPDAATSPETPPGIEICTPPSYPLSQRVFLDLPILQFLRSTTTVFEATLPFMSSPSALGSILHENLVSSTPGPILAAAKSLMPISAFEKELPGSSITLNNISHATSALLLKVVAYAISNNFPGHCDRAEIHKWLRSLQTFSPHIVTLLQDPSNQALLQGLLRLAVEAGDVALARTLLNSGADPNENVCLAKFCPIALRPLQYACLHGNLELVRELLRAKAEIDHPEFGLSCSPLLFCIVGCFGRDLWSHLAEEAPIEAIGTGAGDLADSMNDSDDDDDNNTDNVDHATMFRSERRGRQVKSLLTLIRELLEAGADVNAVSEDLDDTEYSLKQRHRQSDPSDPWYSLVYEKHSALTLASSFRCPELVDLLILSGAEISFHIDGARSALRECLYTSGERFYSKECDSMDINIERLEACPYITLADRLEWRDDWTGVVETAKKLIMAGVDVNDHEVCHPSGRYCEVHPDFECLSAFDLGILTQDRDLIDTLWSAGARPTAHSYELALEAEDYDTFCHLLESEAEFPEWLVTRDEWSDDDDDWDGMIQEKPRKATDRQKRRAMILAAIRLGECASLENLLRSCDCSDLFENCDALLQEAIERCCARGHRETLVCLLQSKILPQRSLASTLGSSIALAIHWGHLKTVDVLLAAGADVNAPLGGYSGKGLTPLRLASRLGNHKELIQKLLCHGAIDGGPDQEKHNDLGEAIWRGDLDGFRSILQRDVENGRSVSNSLHHALRFPAVHRQEFLRLLLEAGACPDITTSDDYNRGTLTTLLQAIFSRHPGCVKIILETEASTNEELPPGTAYSPLQLAAFEGNPEVVRMLLDHGQDPNIVSSYTKHRQGGDYRWYSRSLHMFHPIGTSVQNATAENSYEIVKTLLQHGAKPDSTTKLCPHTALQIACRDGSLDLVEVLIEYGANVNAPPAAEFGATALQFAAIGGYMGIAHLLLEKEADVNAEPAATGGRTALEGAAEHGRIDMVQLLRNAGADISESGVQGQYERALRRASSNGHSATARLLRSFLS